jgi:hypothetical protein
VLPVALAGVAVGVVIVLLGAILFMLRDDDSSPSAVAGQSSVQPSAVAPVVDPTSTSEPSSSDQPTTKSPRKHHRNHVEKQEPPVQVGPGAVTDLPAGLFCRDLNAEGYSYTAAVDYWKMHGQPNQMDADRNGRPCETVYPSSDIDAYWGPQQDYDYGTDSDGLASGLFCRDLYAMGYGYETAVDYWFSEGAPDRMDADGNGIPCETVYSAYDVDQYWY